MTLIQVAKETGASVIGIDIDPQAVDLDVESLTS